MEARDKLGDELFRMNVEWISGTNDDAFLERRDAVIKQLSENYWQLDPYVRARSILDRTGIVQEGGKVDFYPAPVEEVQIQTEVEPKVISEVTNTQDTAVAA